MHTRQLWKFGRAGLRKQWKKRTVIGNPNTLELRIKAQGPSKLGMTLRGAIAAECRDQSEKKGQRHVFFIVAPGNSSGAGGHSSSCPIYPPPTRGVT